MPLIGQLVAPPLQPGPIRLPEGAPLEQRDQQQRSKPPILEGEPGPRESKPPSTEGAPSAPQMAPTSWRPSIQGKTPYDSETLANILASCGKPTTSETLNACAAALTARLTRDGYVNTRVYTMTAPAPGRLEVVEGRIVELRVTSRDPSLAADVQRRLKGLKGQVLHLPSLEKRLVAIRTQAGLQQISGNIGRLGSDPTQAVLNLSVEGLAAPWQGEASIRNDGNGGTGQWRAVATALKNNLAKRQDTFLSYIELNADSDPEFGGITTSLSYTWPLSDQWRITGSFGYSRKNLVESPGSEHELSFRQFQALGQIETTLYSSAKQTWTAFAGISGNRNDSYLSGRSIPLIFGGGPSGWLNSGYLRAGVNGSLDLGNTFLSGNIYALQGLAGFSTSQQLANLNLAGIKPGESRALGALINASWAASPNLSLNARAAGQIAFAELTNDMGFSLGSDVGLRGLPGTLISGDNGYLGTCELVWTVWRPQKQAIQLVPFIGIGGVSTTRQDLSFNDAVGSGGILARWLAGQNWLVELGWVKQFSSDNNQGFWNDWLIGNGLYTKVQFRF